MYTTLPLFVLLACAHGHGRNDDLDPILQVHQLFSSAHHASAITKRQTGEPSLINSDAEIKSSIEAIFRPNDTPTTPSSNLSCTLPHGKIGICVNYYLCVVGTNIINTDGIGIIGSRTIRNRRYAVTTDGVSQSNTRVTSHKRRRRAADESDGQCVSNLHKCCLLPDKRALQRPTTQSPASTQPLREGCGWRRPEGVGDPSPDQRQGYAKFGEFPWMISVLKFTPLNKSEAGGRKVNLYVGGGSLIHPSVVLTAAAIVGAGGEMRARAGQLDAKNNNEPLPYQDRDVRSFVVHEDFNKDNLHNNVALLFLDKPMELVPNVGLACLPAPHAVPPAGTRCFATGWGKDKSGYNSQYQRMLKKVKVPLVARDTCQGQLRKTWLGEFFELHPSVLCAGGEAGVDVCEGDGGSPLVCPVQYQNDRYTQTGIVSWGVGCGREGIPGEYVDVASFRDWIDDQILKKGYVTSTYEP